MAELCLCGVTSENCYKIKDHLNERGRYNVYRAFSVIQSAISSFGQELKAEADKRLAKIKADMEEYRKQEAEKQKKPFQDADKYLSQLQDEVTACRN